jgi:hypothetical protein
MGYYALSRRMPPWAPKGHSPGSVSRVARVVGTRCALPQGWAWYAQALSPSQHGPRLRATRALRGQSLGGSRADFGWGARERPLPAAALPLPIIRPQPSSGALRRSARPLPPGRRWLRWHPNAEGWNGQGRRAPCALKPNVASKEALSECLPATPAAAGNSALGSTATRARPPRAPLGTPAEWRQREGTTAAEPRDPSASAL